VQVQKLQAVEEKRMVPYVVQKPVTRLVENKVPVTQVQWIQEQHVRPVTTQRESFKMETVVEEVPVRTTTMERVVQKVKVPVKVARRVEVKETRMVPRQVATRIPLDYYDPFTPISSASIPSLPSVVQPAASLSPRPSDSGWKESASGTAGNGNAGASSSTNSGAGESSRSSAPLPGRCVPSFGTCPKPQWRAASRIDRPQSLKAGSSRKFGPSERLFDALVRDPLRGS
jgi:hypothetical protein